MKFMKQQTKYKIKIWILNGVKENLNYEKYTNNPGAEERSGSSTNYLFQINNKNINPYINVISNSSSNNNSIISSTNKSCQSTSNKKNLNYSSEDEEKSLNLISNQIKIEKNDKDKRKRKR